MQAYDPPECLSNNTFGRHVRFLTLDFMRIYAAMEDMHCYYILLNGTLGQQLKALTVTYEIESEWEDVRCSLKPWLRFCQTFRLLRRIRLLATPESPLASLDESAMKDQHKDLRGVLSRIKGGEAVKGPWFKDASVVFTLDRYAHEQSAKAEEQADVTQSNH